MRRLTELPGAGSGRLGRDASGQQQEGIPEEKRSDEAKYAGLAEPHVGEGEEQQEGEDTEKAAAEDLEDVVHSESSLVGSAGALMGLSLSTMAFPEHTGPAEIMAGLGAWLVLAVFAYAMERRGYRKGVAELSPDRFGSGRMALVFVVFGLCVFRIEGLEPLAGVVAVSAMALGGVADGAWIALMAERRGVGFFGALREWWVRSKDTRKWRFRSLLGEDRR